MLSCCAALLLAAQPSVAQPVNQDAPLMGAAQVDELVVLDINGSHAALRLLETGVDEVASEMCSTKPVACRYPGLPKPTSGVTLYLLELATQKLTPFVVNPTAFKGCGERRRCLSHAQAKRRLKGAKAAFAKAGLDITNKPQATHTISWAHKATEHVPPEPENPETTTADQMVLGISTIEQTLAWGGRKLVLRSTDTRSALEGEVVSEVLEGKSLVPQPPQLFDALGGWTDRALSARLRDAERFGVARACFGDRCGSPLKRRADPADPALNVDGFVP